MRSSLPRAVALRLAAVSVALHGCGPLQDAAKTSQDVPVGEPPPAGFATEMVAAHDAVRANPAIVGGYPAPSPALAPLGWSATVAARAQQWANGCVYRHDAASLQALGYGENIAAAYPPGSFSNTRVVQTLWGGEAPFYTYATNGCDAANPSNTAGTCGHYTQLVWRGTTVVGCGFTTCSAATWPFGGGTPGPWDYWVCDYAPPGNWIGERPY